MYGIIDACSFKCVTCWVYMISVLYAGTNWDNVTVNMFDKMHWSLSNENDVAQTE